MDPLIAVFCISVFVGLFCWAVVKYPKLFKVWVFDWLYDTADMSLDHWGLREKYEDELYLASRYVMLLRVANHLEGDSVDLKNEVASIVEQTYKIFYEDDAWNEEDVRLATTTFMATIKHEEIVEVARSIFTSQDIEVKKATLLAIDILGELVDLSDELGQQYFQHLIYGLNKSLIIIRDHGTSKSALKEVSTTLFRVYKLTKAYKHRRGLEDLTKEEFYEKVSSTFRRLSRIFGL